MRRARVARRKVGEAGQAGRRIVGTLYRRTRTGRDRKRAQRAEVRFDELAGCLRTPVGGSSRQTIFLVKGAAIRSRVPSPRETARLAVRFLAANLLETLLGAPEKRATRLVGMRDV